MTNLDIRTRVELKNTTQREKIKAGMAGKVALIGAFPSSKQTIYACENYSQLVNHYGVHLGTTDVSNYGGVRAGRRIFMDGISGLGGASSISCINICTKKPVSHDPYAPDYRETYTEVEKYDSGYGIINPDINTNVDPEVIPEGTLEKDRSLSFEKLKKALLQIADEDMDILFIACNLWDIFDHPLERFTYNPEQTSEDETDINKKTFGKFIPIIDEDTGEQVVENNVLQYEKDKYGFLKTVDTYNKIPIYKYILKGDGRPKPDPEDTNEKELNKDNLIHYYYEFVTVNQDNEITACQGPETETVNSVTIPVYRTERYTDGTYNKLLPINGQVHSQQGANKMIKRIVTTTNLVNVYGRVYAYEVKKDGYDTPMYYSIPITDASMGGKGETIYGRTETGKLIRNIGDVYDYILDFIDNEFTSHRPVNYVGAVMTKHSPEAVVEGVNPTGVIFKENLETPGVNKELEGMNSQVIRVTSKIFEEDDPEYVTPTADNPYVNIDEWGATDIADLFTRETNELSTCGLFYQRGIINGEEVDEIELAAHMCGWICSINIAQDLTYKTIPGLTAVNEEAYLGELDAGNILNQHGIQVIRPKNRLSKTFYVNNSIQPAGWHTNHVRSVTYLLKKLSFEDGLGINNFTTNVETFRAMLETIAKEVLAECDVIRSVTIGEVEVISHYHIFVPIDIVLSGVITRINIGVSMALDENGKVETAIKSTSGYSVINDTGYSVVSN